jgi:hypothetical protein
MANYSDMVDINPTFAVNDYQKPKYLSEKESYVSDILMILFGKPGFYPSIPTLGMDIRQYLYMFEDEISPDAIKSKLIAQCEEFDETINTEDMDVVATVYQERLLLIFVLPIINDSNRSSVMVGVTTNTAGEVIYNFVEDKDQIL